VFDCALGPLIDELPGSAGALLPDGLVGGAEGLAAEGLLVDGLAVEGELVEPAPELVELLELPELLCAIATPPYSSSAASVAAGVTFMATISIPSGSTNRDDACSARPYAIPPESSGQQSEEQTVIACVGLSNTRMQKLQDWELGGYIRNRTCLRRAIPFSCSSLRTCLSPSTWRIDTPIPRVHRLVPNEM
jgi:hypothetical protein